MVSALVPYKRIDVGHRRRPPGRNAPENRRRGAGPRPPGGARARRRGVEFLGFQTDEAVRDLYRGAAAVLLPGEEDFGIVPVEAQACGRPVVALARGGALETVLDG